MLVPLTATLGIRAYADAYATNYLGNPLTDRAGDNVAASAGAPVVTSVTQIGNVQIGTSGHHDAINDDNLDYTNKSVNTGIAGVVFGGNTTAPGTLVYTNTLKNTGNADDIFTITAPTVPTGFTVEISTNAGTDYTDVSTKRHPSRWPSHTTAQQTCWFASPNRPAMQFLAASTQ